MLMQGSPPPPGEQVTLANWQDPPYNRWAFSHMRELVPTQPISRGAGPASPLPADPQPLGEVALQRADGSEGTVDAVLADTYTDAVVIVHGGRVVFEQYAGETGPATPHLLMSVSKSVVELRRRHPRRARRCSPPTDLVTDHVPELEDSGYQAARVRDLLDMRSGVKFSEDYLDLDAEVRVMEEAMGWRPTSHLDVPQSMYAFLTALGRPASTAASSSTAPARPTSSGGSARGPRGPGWPT